MRGVNAGEVPKMARNIPIDRDEVIETANRPMATIRVKMGHFAPENSANRATCDCFQFSLTIK